MNLDTGTIIAICTGFAGLISCTYYFQGVAKNFKHDRDAFRAEILQTAKEAFNLELTELTADRQVLYNKLDAKIDALDSELDAHKREVSKDLSHIRETYNGEIRNLGTKIEDLRSELRNQHGQLVGLLSEMIKKSD